jgi:hypothetical protein
MRFIPSSFQPFPSFPSFPVLPVLPVLHVFTSDVIRHRRNARFTGAVGATEEGSLSLDPVTYDPASAVFTHRRQLMYGALKAVESMGFAGRDYLEREVVIVAADFALSHHNLLALDSTVAVASTLAKEAFVRQGGQRYRRSEARLNHGLEDRASNSMAMHRFRERKPLSGMAAHFLC